VCSLAAYRGSNCSLARAMDGRKQIDKQDYLSTEGRPPANTIHRNVFCACGLDLHPMTQYKPDLKIRNMYLQAKMDFLGQGFQKLHSQMRPTFYHDCIRGW